MSKEIKLVMYHYVRDLKNSAYPHIKGPDSFYFGGSRGRKFCDGKR